MGLLVQTLHGLPDPFLLGVSTDLPVQFSLENHSLLGTLAAGDSAVTLQPVHGDLLIDHTEAAGNRDGHRICKTFHKK